MSELEDATREQWLEVEQAIVAWWMSLGTDKDREAKYERKRAALARLERLVRRQAMQEVIRLMAEDDGVHGDTVKRMTEFAEIARQ